MRRKINILLILRADRLTFIKFWVEYSYVAHPTMRGDTGDTISIRRGSLTGISMKHINNNKSSKYAELIRADDAMPQILWNQ